MIRADTTAVAVRKGLPDRPSRVEPVEAQESRRRLTIFHLHQKTSLSTGSVQQMIQAAGGLRARGHRIIMVTPPSSELADGATASGIEIRSLPFRSLLDARTILGLRRLVREHHPDVIHVHKGRAHWLALVSLFRERSPALIVNRGVSFPLTPLNRGKYRSPRVDRIITVCEAIKRVIETTGRIDPTRIEVVYAGTDMVRFDRTRLDPAGFRTRLGIPHDAFVLLHSGTRDWKGWSEVIDAFAAIQETIPTSHLLIAGNDSDERERRVRERLTGRSFSDRVHILGYRDDIEAVMAASDVTVDASWEGTGITGTIRESMAVGTPVIATDCGGNRELLSESGLGWLIPARDHQRLVSAILEVAGDPGRREQVARRAQNLVRSTFSIDRRIDRLEEIYWSCVSERQSAFESREETVGLTG